MSYYTINEEAARRANDMNRFRDYKDGSATAESRRTMRKSTGCWKSTAASWPRT